jgi:hypothetical protein
VAEITAMQSNNTSAEIDHGTAQTDNTGATLSEYGATDAIGDVNIHTLDAVDASIDVEAEYLDDEPNAVHLAVDLSAVDVRLALAPNEAARLAAKLRSAAAFAGAGGDRR